MMGRRAAKIAKVKGREDAKRGKAFARIGKKIIMVCACVFVYARRVSFLCDSLGRVFQLHFRPGGEGVIVFLLVFASSRCS